MKDTQSRRIMSNSQSHTLHTKGLHNAWSCWKAKICTVWSSILEHWLQSLRSTVWQKQIISSTSKSWHKIDGPLSTVSNKVPLYSCTQAEVIWCSQWLAPVIQLPCQGHRKGVQLPYVPDDMCTVCRQKTWPRQWRAISSHPGWTTAMPCSAVHWLLLWMHNNLTRVICLHGGLTGTTAEHFSGNSMGCQSGSESPTRWHCWHSRCSRPQCQHTRVTWSRQLFMFGSESVVIRCPAAVCPKNTKWTHLVGVLELTTLCQ